MLCKNEDKLYGYRYPVQDMINNKGPNVQLSCENHKLQYDSDTGNVYTIHSCELSVIILHLQTPEELALEGTHRVRTPHRILLTLTLTLTFDYITCKISQGHSIYQV